MSSPRPILKRGESYQSTPTGGAAPRYPRHHIFHQHGSGSASSSPPHGVHFPPSPTLTRTFSAYSPSTYDRSPIVVSPNTCALPERGCPGRTYTLDESSKSSPPSRTNWSGSHHGRHLHPRAVNYTSHRQPSPSEDDDEYRDDEDIQRTPTGSYPILPPLIPDLSSESDESDGFISPPPESSHYSPVPNSHSGYYPPPQSNRIAAPSHPPIPYAHNRVGYNTYSNEVQQSPHALSFLPHPASPGDESQKARRRKQRDQSKPRRAVDASYKSSLSALANCSLDEGSCLGGF